MSVNILDDDALDKITKIEGDYWREYTTRTDKFRNDYSFISVKRFYLEARKECEEYAKSIKLPEDSSNNAIEYCMKNNCIYGEGGYNRYIVKSNGNILFSKWHSREEKQKEAQEAGFDLC